MKLTQSNIAQLPRAEDKHKADVIYFDDEMKGFGIRFRGRASTWLIQYRDATGRSRRETLGDVPKLNASEARQLARTRFAAIILGRDPQAEKAEARVRAKLTLGVVADQYLEVKKPTLRPNSYIADHRYLTQHWKPLHDLPVHAVTRRDVASRLGELVRDHGATSAARARGALSALFGWSIREGIAETNPVLGTNDPLAGKDSRDRVLSNHEMRAIWTACRDDDFGRIIRLLMLTGARRDEIGGLRWDELDFDRGVLTIPGTRTKNHRPLILTLPPMAIAILDAAPRREGRELVFGASGGAFSAWSYSTLALLARIAEAEGRALKPWRIHDIRRSVVTGMAEIGVQPHIIETVINHASGHKGGVAGVYNHATYEREVKAALALWAEHVRSIVQGGAPNVVPLRPGVSNRT